jgi:hypothetical protein
MAINFGDVLGGLGAAYGGRAQQYAQGIQQREQGLTERKRAELEARQKAMYQDGYQAFMLLGDPDKDGDENLDGIISLANDRLEMLSTFDDVDPSDTLKVRSLATAARAGDPFALPELTKILYGAANTAISMGIVPQQEQERGVVVGGNLVGQTSGRVMYQGKPQAPEEPAAMQTLRARASESGLRPGTPEYSDFMRSGGGGNGQVINVDTGGGPSDKLNELLDTQLAGYFTAASTSASAAPQLQLLSQLAPLTTEGQIPAALSRMFPTFNDANQAFIGITNQVLPSLRVPGSGAQSDRDIDVLLNSIGPLAASADTKQLLIQSMMQKNAINQQLADVTQQVVDGRITRPQATAMIRQINSQTIISPALQQAMRRIMPEGAQSSIPQSAVDAGVTPDKWNLMTPEERNGWK